MKYFLALLLFSSCATQKNFDRLLAKDPTLIDKYIASKDTLVQRDTFIERDTTVLYDTLYREYAKADTSFLRDSIENPDTFYQNTDKVNVRVIITSTGVHISTKVKPDTTVNTKIIYRDKIVYVDKVVIQERVATWKVWQNWLIHKWKTLIVVIIILLILWFFGKKLL